MGTTDYLRRDQQAMEFAHLRIGQVAAVNLTTRSCTVNLPGVVATGVTYAGPAPQVGDIAYCVSEGTVIVALGFDRGVGVPVGSIVAYGSTTAPFGWKVCDGTAFPAGSEYDDVKAIYGANAPNLQDRFIAGRSGTKALFSTGGAETVTLIEANLPAHAHTINHDHPSVNSSFESAHTHSIAHDHGAFNSGGGGAHAHTTDSQSVSNYNIDNRYAANSPAAWYYGIGAQWTSTVADHAHSIDVPAFSGNSGGGSAHQHAVDVAAFTGNSGNGAGTATAINKMPPYYALVYIVKMLPV